MEPKIDMMASQSSGSCPSGTGDPRPSARDLEPPVPLLCPPSSQDSQELEARAPLTPVSPLDIPPSPPPVVDSKAEGRGGAGSEDPTLQDPVESSQDKKEEALEVYQKVKFVDPKGQGELKGPKTKAPPPKVSQPLTNKAAKATKGAGSGSQPKG